MEHWYLLELGDGVDAFKPTMEIQGAFFALSIARRGDIKDIAVFSRYDLKTNIVTVYFSPKAKQLAEKFNAAPCEKPSGDGIGLIAGDAYGLEAFFPTRKRT